MILNSWSISLLVSYYCYCIKIIDSLKGWLNINVNEFYIYIFSLSLSSICYYFVMKFVISNIHRLAISIARVAKLRLASRMLIHFKLHYQGAWPPLIYCLEDLVSSHEKYEHFNHFCRLIADYLFIGRKTLVWWLYCKLLLF